MKRVFLLAHPAKHSVSAPMHNAAFKVLGIEAHYETLDVAPESLRDVVEGLRAPDVFGSNVTVPHKLAVFPLMDELSEAAKSVGAVNTIINKKGKLLGHNTDATGYVRALEEDGKFSLKDKKILLLGAGGAARAIVYAVLKAGCEKLAIYNRSQEKAQALVAEFAHLGRLEALSELTEMLITSDLVINSTSVGMEHNGIDPDESPLSQGLMPAHAFVSDIVYRPEKTRLLKDAEAAGLKFQNGLPMLIYQGAESFECWTGKKPPIDLMFAAAREALRS
ncbi:MAG: shikimate dehydrogenase [Trueperaceae bacterium]|nr:shikimate dehydrogenase [Trueperaceae bacterium]